jgi:hypothetical protein
MAAISTPLSETTEPVVVDQISLSAAQDIGQASLASSIMAKMFAGGTSAWMDIPGPKM